MWSNICCAFSQQLMLRLRLTVLTTRNETWRLWKWISKFHNSNFMPAILSRLSILCMNYISSDLANTKILLSKLFFRYLVVKPACVNAALEWQLWFIDLSDSAAPFLEPGPGYDVPFVPPSQVLVACNSNIDLCWSSIHCIVFTLYF